VDIAGVLIILGFLLFFGLMIYFAVQSTRKDREAKRQAAQQLGFCPVEPDAILAGRIFSLYQWHGAREQFRLRNVSRKSIPDGEMYLFDLIDTAGESENEKERQAVAIVSPGLALPFFSFYPKMDTVYTFSGLTNGVIEWGLSKLAPLVDFPEFPELTARYMIRSEDEGGMHRLVDASLAHYFAQTSTYVIHAGGDLFVFSELDQRLNRRDPENIAGRITRAMDVFQQLLGANRGEGR